VQPVFAQACHTCFAGQQPSKAGVCLPAVSAIDWGHCCGTCWAAAVAAPAVSGIISRQRLLTSGR
jgi:hypothetical protein